MTALECCTRLGLRRKRTDTMSLLQTSSIQARDHDNSNTYTSRDDVADCRGGRGVVEEQQPHSTEETPVPYTEFVKGRPANVPHVELVKIPNPYRWPLILRNCGLEVNGVTCFTAPVTEDPVARVKSLRAIPMREDDILLYSFHKCGTHWMSLMVDMLLKGSAELKDTIKAGAFLEMEDDLAALQDVPSPRFLNSHLPFVHLPEEIVDKKVKILHIYRKMKDQTVSFYHHARQYFDPRVENLTFDNFLKGYLTEGYSNFGHQWDFLKQLWEFERANPSHPIKHVSYEALRKNPLPALRGVLEFLGIPASEDFCRDVIESCRLENVKKEEQRRNRPITVYRKGLVGDWKNVFTVAQSEQFDEYIRCKEKNSDRFSMTYFEGLSDVHDSSIFNAETAF